MFDTRPYTSKESQFTEEQIKTMLPASYIAWKDSYSTFFIELTRKQEETGLQPSQCWWFPWAILRPFFEVKGYTLYDYDPQGDPGESPHMEGPPMSGAFGLYGDCSETRSYMASNPLVFGARDRQNRDVVIKLVDKYSPDHPDGSTELQILRLLNSSLLRSDPRNATVPVLEFLEFDDWQFVVMPFYGHSEQYFLLNSQECLDYACQVLDALSFLHQHRIAHLDVSNENIMMNFRGALPRYFLPYPGQRVDEEKAPPPEFRSTFPVKYSLIDFGNSAYFIPGLHRSRCLIAPTKFGRPHRAPEVDGDFKHDPFAADVYQTAVFLFSYFGRIIAPEVPGLLELLQDMSSLHAPDRVSMSAAASRMRSLYNALAPREALPRHIIMVDDYYCIPRSKFRFYREYIKWFVSEKWKSFWVSLRCLAFSCYTVVAR